MKRLFALISLSFVSCATPQGFQHTAMDQTRHFVAQPMDAYYAQQSKDLIRNEQGRMTWRLGEKMMGEITFKEWMRRGHRGMLYTGHGYEAGDHAAEYTWMGGPVYPTPCAVGPITTSLWKNGGERGSLKYW